MEAKDLLSRLLERDPFLRISPEEAIAHPWSKMFEEGGRMYRDSCDVKFQGEGIEGLLGKVKAKLNKEYKN